MMMNRVWITLVSVLAAVAGGAESTWVLGETASFYGASYVAVPLQDAKSTTDLRLRFRTRRSDAMLFLAAGRTDYCLVRLETGRLKVHINLGAGESEVASAKGLRLDDLMWHDVVITRKDGDMTLQVDTIHITREALPGRFYELNIHFGLFVGGRGDFSELFLGHVDNLRGCIADVVYNGVDVLSRARERIGQVDVHGVTWSCAEEFDAGKDRDISFVEEGAFMALPNAITRTGARWQLDLKTSSRRGTLLYNTGPSSRSDFVGVELWEGRVRLTVDKGNGPAELVSEATVSDGRWHSVAVQFNPAYLEITVDGRVSSLRLPLTGSGSRYLDLAETVYVGGIELNKRARALHQGVRSAEESFKGCLRGMELDGRRLGIPEARVTMGIRADCVWEYPCTGDPCVPGAVCLQQGVDSFRCECGQPLCVKPDYATSYKVFTKTTLPVDLEIIELTPLQVAEGRNALVTTANLDVVLDYPKYGVRDSGVLFRQVAPPPPRHGQLQVDMSIRRLEDSSSTMFTLLDVAKDKVRYLHDGSESHQDAIVLEMELSAGSGFTLPGYLQGRHRFVLPVNITPVNDPPQLILQPGEVLRIAQGTKKTLTAELLHAEDPDNPNSDLVYTVLSSGGEGKGFIENSRNPGKSVDTFTQKDVDLGLISYVHRGGGQGAGGEMSGRVVLRVSDGIEAGPAAVLRVSAFELQLRLVNNTGLVLTHNTSAVITPEELSFATNAEDQGLEVRYDVTQAPQYGILQRMRGGASGGMARWQAVDHFTSRQLARDQIRYQHTIGEPEHDFFKFKVSVMEAKNPTVYDFRIKFVELRLEHVRNLELTMDGIQEIPITEDNLLYQTKPTPTDPSRLTYHLLRGTRYGALTVLRPEPSGPKQQHRRLMPGDTFNQKDLADGKVRYRLHRRTYSRAHDDFLFRVTTPELSTDPATFSIAHVPGPDEYAAVSATIERLEVLEGGRATISRRHLHLQTDRIFDVSYNVTRGPHHGHLDVLDSTLTETVRHNASWFDSREITADKLIYVHDDSESKRDSFHFVALGDNFQFVGVFHIEIVLKNDNTPTRAVDRVFRVVSGGERLLTGRDLRYDDADIDSRPSEIVYTRRGIPNGSLLSASDPAKPIFEFTQEDLNEGRVLFRHEGDEYGKIGLWITDGQFYANGILEVRASPPFVEITNATGLVVRRGGITTISSYNLSAETNVNAFGEQLQYFVIEGPRHGRLDVGGRPAEKFTERDLEAGRLTYRHDGGSAVRDHFVFRVDARGEASVDGRFDIRIFPASYWEPLVVSINRTLEVEESTSVCICSSALKVMHPMIPSSDITFFVQKPPVNGYLEVEDNNAITDDFPDEVGLVDGSSSLAPPFPSANPSAFQDEVTVFDQSLIDDSRLQYIQGVANATEDHFVLDATNGITWLRGLIVKFVVVPKNIFIGTSGEVTVTEGGSVTLPSSLLVVLTGYYAGRVLEYRVVQQPMAGSLRASHRPGKVMDKFTLRQLEENQITYQHDGSETSEDEFAVVGRAGDKESIPVVVRIVVSPVNDEPPRLVNNTGLELWEGASAPVTNTHLAAEDPDSSAENITFTISSVKSGYVALKSASRLPITQFTQAQINAGVILFVHMGGRSGGFRLTLSDGANSGGTHDFEVTALDLTLRLAANNPLHVFPMLRQPLASDELSAVTSDTTSPGRRIVYSIRTPPVLGRLLVEPSGGAAGSSPSLPRGPLVPTARDPALPASNFTQHDINENRVWYEHTHPFTDLMANDSFIFDVSADFAEPLLEQVFRIDISVSSMTSGGLDRFLVLEPIEVEEGGSAVLRMNTTGVAAFIEAHSGWAPPVIIEVALWSAPRHGTLAVAGVNASSGTTFTQAHLDAGEVIYNHDHSDTVEDDVPFSLRLPSPEDSTPGDVLLYNGTIRITIRPINDQPFHLLTRAPHVAVVQGGMRAITQEDLCTEDPDTPSEELVYDVISGPSAGRLMLASNSSGQGGSDAVLQFPAVRFTQADINSGRVSYEHTGPLAPASFYFRVWDGQFNPVYTVFNIRVLPLSLNITRLAPIPIRQGSSVTFIEEAHLNLTTNGRRESVRYNVTQPPRHGTIFVHDVAVSSFGQADVDSKKVMYMQTDMTAPGDSFSLSAWLEDSDVKLPNMRFNITVTPFINIGNFTPISGGRNVITPKFLDASPLAHLTSSNPTYTITRRPKLGRFKRIIRSTEARRVREKEVTRFTHEEVESGVIYYVARRMEGPGQEDSFSFLLTATIFQPAHGEVKFRVSPESERRVQDQATAGVSSDATPPPRKSSGHSGDVASGIGNRPEVASPNMSNDYVLIVAVGAGVVTLAVLIIVAVKCCSLRTREDRGSSGKHHEARPGSAYGPGGVPVTGPNGDLYGGDLDSAPPLPRPPDHLLPLHPTSPRPPRGKRFVAANGSTQRGDIGKVALDSWRDGSPTVPQCKVIPLEPMDVGVVVGGGVVVGAGEAVDVNARYPYGVPDEPTEDWSSYDTSTELQYPPRTTNPMLRRNQYWV